MLYPLTPLQNGLVLDGTPETWTFGELKKLLSPLVCRYSKRKPISTLQKVHVEFRSKIRSLRNLDTLFRSNFGNLREVFSEIAEFH